MKKRVIWLGIAGIVVVDLASWNRLVASREERGEIYFAQPATIAGVKLEKGYYLVVHKDDAMNKEGESCTFFSRVPSEDGRQAAKPAAQVRCIPKDGMPVERFTVKTSLRPDGTVLVQSIQFPGSTEVHTY